MLFFWQGYFELPQGFSDYYKVISRDVFPFLPYHTREVILAMLAELDG